VAAVPSRSKASAYDSPTTSSGSDRSQTTGIAEPPAVVVHAVSRSNTAYSMSAITTDFRSSRKRSGRARRIHEAVPSPIPSIQLQRVSSIPVGADTIVGARRRGLPGQRPAVRYADANRVRPER
jgi:hypothetical protein